VTVCIAAICKHGDRPVIVCCADTAGTYGDFIKADDEHKFEHVNKYCVILLAGPPSHAKELIASIKIAVAEFDNAEKKETDFDLRINALLEKIRKAVREHKARIAEHYLGINYLTTTAEFKSGLIFKEDRTAIQREIANLSIGCELIIADNSDVEPVLIEVTSSGDVHWQEKYICVGHGQDIALAIMCQDEHDELIPMMDCVAKVYFAKKAAEKDPTVGQGTSMAILTGWAEDAEALSEKGWEKLDKLLKPIRAPKNIKFNKVYFRSRRASAE
jgi:20S proteasome alpha/beta subunit